MSAAALRNKVSTKTVRPTVSRTTNTQNKPTPPSAGFRNETIKDQRVITAITETPGLTCREYADRLGYMTTIVNDCLLRTLQGRALAEAGMVAVPSRGAVPQWVKLIKNTSGLVRRQRVNQFPAIKFSNKIKGTNRSSIAAIAQLVGEMPLHVSPRMLLALHDEINLALISTGRDRAREQELLSKMAIIEAELLVKTGKLASVEAALAA